MIEVRALQPSEPRDRGSAAAARLRIEDIEVTLVGAGRAGAHVAIVLAMLGARLRIYDADRLGPENQGLQLYAKPDVDAGRLKVEALRTWVSSVVPGAHIAAHPEDYAAHAHQPVSPIVVLAVDRMHTRRRLWNRMRARPDLSLWIDVRLGSGVLRVLSVRLQQAPGSGTESAADVCAADVREYEASLHADAIAASTDCTDEGTSHAAAAAAGIAAGVVRAFLAARPHPRWVAVNLDRGHWASGPTRL